MHQPDLAKSDQDREGEDDDEEEEEEEEDDDEGREEVQEASHEKYQQVQLYLISCDHYWSKPVPFDFQRSDEYHEHLISSGEAEMKVKCKESILPPDIGNTFDSCATNPRESRKEVATT